MRGLLAPVVPLAARLCRGYQRLFPASHPGEGTLVGLHRQARALGGHPHGKHMWTQSAERGQP
ncbi:MAG: hypothetical protein FJW23_04010 [Acidimicrobiia bacterium]|nr:hypothetical protein [Acidimicrobiia bacterium]